MSDSMVPRVEYTITVERREVAIEPRKDWKQVRDEDPKYEYVTESLPVARTTEMLKVVVSRLDLEAVVRAVFPSVPALEQESR